MAQYCVVDKQQLEADLTQVADVIRAQTGAAEALSFPEEFVSQVRQIGDNAFSAGEQSAWDSFWDMHQDNGNRYDYTSAFAGQGWEKMAREGKFNPKYPIRPVNKYKWHEPITKMFSKFGTGARTPVDLSHVDMDFSACWEAVETFENCNIENIICDFGNCWKLDRVFVASNTDHLGVNKVKLRVTDKVVSCTQVFFYARALEDLEFFGDSVIVLTGMGLGQSYKLTRRSIENVFAVLSDTVSGQSMSFNLTAVNKAFETSQGAADGSTSAAWTALVATKPNWTISLENYI